MSRPTWATVLLAAVAVVAGVAAVAVPAQTAQAPATFRTRTTSRVVEVRVVDDRGRPITGLQQGDFTITENGKPQPIRQFAPIERTNQAVDAREAGGLVPAGTRPSELGVSGRRIFLIVLGRGNLQIPSRGLDGMIRLVQRLLPQDLVAVQAWNRATAFTTDHTKIVAMLERYRDGHQRVEALLAQHFQGLAAIYGSRELPPWVAKDIDAVLHGPGAPEMRTVLPDVRAGEGADARLAGDLSRLQDAPSLDPFRTSDAERIGMSLDEFASTAVRSMQDLTRIYAGVSYLRYLDGDKHLVYVSPAGLNLPSTDDDRSLARVAQDARVSIHVFHSGGIGDIFGVASSMNIAEFTGGQYTGLSYGDRFADRIETATRTGYVLGYDPTDPSLDGTYRRVSVKVNRRGATVLYQHGYYAREEFVALNRRQVIAQGRVEAAVRYTEPVRDLALVVTATPFTTAGRRELVVQVNVDPAGPAVSGQSPERTITLDVAVFCFSRRQLVGYTWRQVDVRLDDARYERYRRLGLGFTVHVPLERQPDLVKAVVYDYTADLVGTAAPPVK